MLAKNVVSTVKTEEGKDAASGNSVYVENYFIAPQLNLALPAQGLKQEQEIPPIEEYKFTSYAELSKILKDQGDYNCSLAESIEDHDSLNSGIESQKENNAVTFVLTCYGGNKYDNFIHCVRNQPANQDINLLVWKGWKLHISLDQKDLKFSDIMTQLMNLLLENNFAFKVITDPSVRIDLKYKSQAGKQITVYCDSTNLSKDKWAALFNEIEKICKSIKPDQNVIANEIAEKQLSLHESYRNDRIVSSQLSIKDFLIWTNWKKTEEGKLPRYSGPNKDYLPAHIAMEMGSEEENEKKKEIQCNPCGKVDPLKTFIQANKEIIDQTTTPATVLTF